MYELGLVYRSIQRADRATADALAALATLRFDGLLRTRRARDENLARLWAARSPATESQGHFCLRAFFRNDWPGRRCPAILGRLRDARAAI